jgi:hypothetical protein
MALLERGIKDTGGGIVLAGEGVTRFGSGITGILSFGFDFASKGAKKVHDALFGGQSPRRSKRLAKKTFYYGPKVPKSPRKIKKKSKSPTRKR